MDIDGEEVGDRFGKFVFLSLDGNVLVIGVILNDGNSGDLGYVCVYEWNGMSWE